MENDLVDVRRAQSPQEIAEFGKCAAKVLTGIIDAQKDKVMINGKQYLQFRDWQTVARFFKCSVGTESVKPIIVKEEIVGYVARAQVMNSVGVVVSTAESMCMKEEKNWVEKPAFQVMSMAQTRANVKALRNVFSWVIVLAGYTSDTSAEEMSNGEQKVEGVKG